MVDITVIERKGLRVEIRSDDVYFTVWADQMPVATIRRATRGNKFWEAIDVDGTLIGKAIGPKTAFNLVVKYVKG